jgi:hypothetical protein
MRLGKHEIMKRKERHLWEAKIRKRDRLELLGVESGGGLKKEEGKKVRNKSSAGDFDAKTHESLRETLGSSVESRLAGSKGNFLLDSQQLVVLTHTFAPLYSGTQTGSAEEGTNGGEGRQGGTWRKAKRPFLPLPLPVSYSSLPLRRYMKDR